MRTVDVQGASSLPSGLLDQGGHFAPLSRRARLGRLEVVSLPLLLAGPARLRIPCGDALLGRPPGGLAAVGRSACALVFGGILHVLSQLAPYGHWPQRDVGSFDTRRWNVCPKGTRRDPGCLRYLPGQAGGRMVDM